MSACLNHVCLTKVASALRRIRRGEQIKIFFHTFPQIFSLNAFIELTLAQIIHKLSKPEVLDSFKQARGDARASIAYSEW